MRNLHKGKESGSLRPVSVPCAYNSQNRFEDFPIIYSVKFSNCNGGHRAHEVLSDKEYRAFRTRFNGKKSLKADSDTKYQGLYWFANNSASSIHNAAGKEDSEGS